MEELAAVLHAALLQDLEDLEELRHREAELGSISPGELPAAGPARRELYADPEDGAHVELLGVSENQLELVELLDDGDDRLPDLLGENDHLDVVVVLEAVADDRHVAAVRQCEHG